MSSLVQAKCTNSAALASSALLADAFLDEIFDRLDVVIGRALDRLDALGVVLAENPSAMREQLLRVRRGENGATSAMPSVVGERQQPAHLDLHAAFHQAVFAEDRAQRSRPWPA